jgi:hypothetical protein
MIAYVLSYSKVVAQYQNARRRVGPTDPIQVALEPREQPKVETIGVTRKALLRHRGIARDLRGL